MKKFFTKIIISAVVLAIFLAPVSPSFQKNSDGNLAINLKNNVALADVVLSASAAAITTNSAIFNIKVTGFDDTWKTHVRDDLYKVNTDNTITKITATTRENELNTTKDGAIIDYTGILSPDTNYRMFLLMDKTEGIIAPDITLSGYRVDFKTTSADGSSPATMNGAPINYTTPNNVTDENQGTSGGTTTISFNCQTIITTFPECLVSAFFWLIWKPISWITTGAAAVLDFFIYYSTNSTSYSQGFIGSAWASVRDIANIFFIIALLYVAIQTILGLGHGPQKMIATIVIVALVINFSLFFTQVIIDASNILAKVFYNHIDAKDANGQTIPPGSIEPKSITVNLVSAFNPQTMIAKTAPAGQAFLTILLSTVLMLFMIYIFISVALLFVGRVAGLWISMIMAPIAFASYTLPFDIPGLGHKEWWDNLLKQAFMAPIFIFFLYIILLLGKSFSLINYDYYKAPDKLLPSVMAVVIPFLLIFILLREAKKLAVKYSGEMGSAFTSAGAVVGGLALGGVALGGAFLGRQTAGRILKGAAKSEAAEKFAAGGTIQSMGTYDYYRGKLGAGINAQQEKLTHAAHARHDLDKVAGEVAHGKKWSDLNAGEIKEARANMARKDFMRQDPDVYAKKKWETMSDEERDTVNAGIQSSMNTKTTKADLDTIKHAKEKETLGESFSQAATFGSYDVRNLSKLVAGEQDKSFNKFATGLTSLMAGGIRGSVKSTIGANYGQGQKDIMKDLGHTITEAMKGAKISVDLSHVGEEKKEAHGGGGGHH